MMAGKVAGYGLLIALAFILSYVETLIPLSFVVPGVKLGLANLAVMIALYQFGWKQAVCLSLVRVVLVSFTFGNLFSMIYSLAGAGLSLSVMLILKKTDRFSMNGVSLAGGVAHNIGQVLAAAAVMENSGLFYWLPVLLVSGTVTGVLIGIAAGQVNMRLEKQRKNFF